MVQLDGAYADPRVSSPARRRAASALQPSRPFHLAWIRRGPATPLTGRKILPSTFPGIGRVPPSDRKTGAMPEPRRWPRLPAARPPARRRSGRETGRASRAQQAASAVPGRTGRAVCVTWDRFEAERAAQDSPHIAPEGAARLQLRGPSGQMLPLAIATIRRRSSAHYKGIQTPTKCGCLSAPTETLTSCSNNAANLATNARRLSGRSLRSAARPAHLSFAGVVEYVVRALLPDELLWFEQQQGAFTRRQMDADGIFRSVVVPGLWLDPKALLKGDRRRLRAVVDLGCATLEHTEFAARLASNRKTT